MGYLTLKTIKKLSILLLILSLILILSILSDFTLRSSTYLYNSSSTWTWNPDVKAFCDDTSTCELCNIALVLGVNPEKKLIG